MSQHTVVIRWIRSGGDFLTGKYSREHTWSFDGGMTVAASSSPSVVPEPFSNAKCVDPEEGFFAAVSSSHRLWFLSIAAQRGLEVERNEEEALGLDQTLQPLWPDGQVLRTKKWPVHLRVTKLERSSGQHSSKASPAS